MIFKPFNKNYSDKEMARIEKAAAKELDEFVTELQERYDVTVCSNNIIGVHSLRGVIPIKLHLEVCSNKRIKNK